MKLLATHFAKELRDQRTSLVALLCVVGTLGLVASFTTPAGTAMDGSVVAAMLRVGAAIGALAIAADLVPSEGERGTLALLARLPRGLLSAFWSKLLLVSVAALAFAWIGASTALLGWHLRFEVSESLAAPGVPFFQPGVAGLFVSVLALGWWVFAIGCWLPRGLAAVLCVLGLGVPYAAALGFANRFGGSEAAWRWLVADPFLEIMLLHALAGFVVALVSFVLGHRRARGPRGALRVGFPVALLTLLPPWALLAGRTACWVLPPTLAEGSRSISSSRVTHDGKLWYVEMARRADFPRHLHVVDVATGSVRETLPYGTRITAWEGTRLEDGEPWFLRRLAVEHTPEGARVLFDSTTREPIRVLDGKSPNPASLARMQRALAEGSEMHLPDGRPLWWLDDHFETLECDGSVRALPWEAGVIPHSARGRGILVSRRSGSRRDYGLFDLGREQLFWARDEVLTAMYVVGTWWLEVNGGRPGRPLERHLALYDPDTKNRIRLPDGVANRDVSCVLSDGRVVLRSRTPGELPRCVLADFERDVFEDLDPHLARTFGAEIASSHFWFALPQARRFRQIEVVCYQGPTQVALWDPESGSWSTSARGEFLGRLSEHEVLLRIDAVPHRVDLRTGRSHALLGH